VHRNTPPAYYCAAWTLHCTAGVVEGPSITTGVHARRPHPGRSHWPLISNPAWRAGR
jgi:hypothetical protein